MSTLDRSRPPLPGQARAFQFPEFQRHRLDNGLNVLVARQPQVPLVSLQLLTPAGAQFDPPSRSGLATLSAGLMDEGTATRSSAEIAQLIEGLGGFLSTGADWNTSYLAIGSLSQHLEAGLDLLVELATTPSFPQHEVERLQRERLAEILRRRDRPAVLAEECFDATVYAGTVYARSPLGCPETVGAIERRDVVEFYRRHHRSRGAHLIAVGDLDPERLLALVSLRFAGLPEMPSPAPVTIEPSPLVGISVHILDRPMATQTELRLGHVGVPRCHPDRAPLALMNSLLGGKFTSRLNLNLRERHGYTYGAVSRFVNRLGPGPFVVKTAVANGVVGDAAREILAELRRLRQDRVAAEELEDSRTYLKGLFPYSLQTIDGVTRHLEELATYSLPDDFFSDYLAELDRVDDADILRVAQTHLYPDDLVLVAVGPASVLQRQLESLGTVRASPLEGNPTCGGTG